MSESYTFWRKNLFRGSVVRESEASRPTEISLQSRWFSGEFGYKFVSVDGLGIEIIHPGTWNHSAGPDFVDAAVRIGGETVRGDIELDWHAGDWEQHGHGCAESFRRVVLHVFFQTNNQQRHFTRSVEHREVPQVLIDPETVSVLDESFELTEVTAGSCARGLAAFSAPDLEDFLWSAARYRLECKAARIRGLRDWHGLDQALYQELAVALGYRPNKLPMEVLAQRHLIKDLLREKPETVEALLFGGAGFLEAPYHQEFGEEKRAYQAAIWAEWWRWRADGARAPELPWRFGGLRPVNHPQRRVAALTALVLDWKSVVAVCTTDPLDIKKVEKLFLALKHPFWSHHYTLKSARSDTALALIGRSRFSEILVNQIFPLQEALGRSTDELYRPLSSRLDNQKIRRAAGMLFAHRPDADKLQSKLYHQQALLQIYDDYCLATAAGCAGCPFPGQIEKGGGKV